MTRRKTPASCAEPTNGPFNPSQTTMDHTDDTDKDRIYLSYPCLRCDPWLNRLIGEQSTSDRSPGTRSPADELRQRDIPCRPDHIRAGVSAACRSPRHIEHILRFPTRG